MQRTESAFTLGKLVYNLKPDIKPLPVIDKITLTENLLNLNTSMKNTRRMEGSKSAFKILTGNPTGKRPLGRPRRRWEDNIRMYLEEIGINNGRNT